MILCYVILNLCFPRKNKSHACYTCYASMSTARLKMQMKLKNAKRKTQMTRRRATRPKNEKSKRHAYTPTRLAGVGRSAFDHKTTKFLLPN